MKLLFRIACASLFAGSAAHSEDLGAAFDHLAESNMTRTIEPKPGDRITTTITSTCPSRFLYAWTPMATSPDPQTSGPRIAGILPACDKDIARKKLEAAGYCAHQDQNLEFVHAMDTGGYIISVTKKSDAPKEVRGLPQEEFDSTVEAMAKNGCVIPEELGKKKQLKDTTYYLSINDSPWAIGMSGGVSISSVVDPRFAIIDDPASTTTPPGTIVIHDKSADDEQKIGFAGYLHVHHERFKAGPIPLAFTLGLGIDDQSSINTMVGLSFAASDLAYVTLGWNWSAIDRLPTGQQLGKAPIDENVLNNLAKRTDSGWFLGVSFKFMSPGKEFFKGKVVPKVENPKEGDTQ